MAHMIVEIDKLEICKEASRLENQRRVNVAAQGRMRFRQRQNFFFL
jgi:hypothetical protein